MTALRDMLATAFAADIAAVTPEVCEVLHFAVRARFDAKLAARVARFARTSGVPMDDLSPLDDAAPQVGIALDQCAARLREQASAELFQLSARWALDTTALLHAPDLCRQANSLLGDPGALPGVKARYGSTLQIGLAAERSVPAMLDERVLTSLLERLLGGERAQVAPTGVAANASVGTTAAVPSRFTGTRVMVVDDSNTIRRYAEIFLKQAGCEVILADNGFEALAKVAIDRPDLILLDILMPRLDGYQTCALLRKNAMHRATPIVMLSSKDTMFDRAKGRMAGSNEHLAKPFTKENLLNVLAAQLAPHSHGKPTSKTMEGVIRA